MAHWENKAQVKKSRFSNQEEKEGLLQINISKITLNLVVNEHKLHVKSLKLSALCFENKFHLQQPYLVGATIKQD